MGILESKLSQHDMFEYIIHKYQSEEKLFKCVAKNKNIVNGNKMVSLYVALHYKLYDLAIQIHNNTVIFKDDGIWVHINKLIQFNNMYASNYLATWQSDMNDYFIYYVTDYYCIILKNLIDFKSEKCNEYLLHFLNDQNVLKELCSYYVKNRDYTTFFCVIEHLIDIKNNDLIVKYLNNISIKDMPISDKIYDYLIENKLYSEISDIDKYTLLLKACFDNKTDIANQLIDQLDDARIDQCSELCSNRGNTPLIMACFRNNTEIALKLLSLPDNLCGANIINQVGETALILACANNNTEIALKLISLPNNLAKVDHIVNKQTNYKANAWKEWYIDPTRNFTTFGDVSNNTALIIACQQNNTEIAKALISSGRSLKASIPLRGNCNIGHYNGRGDTPLIIACMENNTEIVEKLISVPNNLARTNHLNRDNLSALNIMVQHNNTKIVKQLLQMPNTGGHLIEIRKVTLSSASLVTGDVVNSITYLMIAIEAKNSEMAQYIIDVGSKISMLHYVDTDGYTALMYACKYKLNDVALKLLKYSNSNPLFINNYGVSAHSIALSNGMNDVSNKLSEMMNKLNV
jgi:ankyrin repeat protein